MIDLSGHSSLLISTAFDELAGTATLTIKDSSGVTTLGVITMDKARFRPFVDVLGAISKIYFDTLSTVPQGYRMNYDVSQNLAKVVFG